MEVQVDPNHYLNTKYDYKGRWISYWHQINEILSSQPNSVLEVGVGNGLVSDYLKKRKLNITTLDIDKRLSPDKVGSVLDIPFERNSFDLVVCFEVLEHLPFNKFELAIAEMKRVSRGKIIISVPDCTRVYRLSFQLPKLGEFKTLIPLPRFKPQEHKFDGQHYWEIGKKNYPISVILKKIADVNLQILENYRVFELPAHRFFVLESK